MATEGSTATLDGRVRLRPALSLPPCLSYSLRLLRTVTGCTVSGRYCILDRQRYMDEFNDLNRKDVFCFLLSTRAGGEHILASLSVCVRICVGIRQADGKFVSSFYTHLVFDRFGNQPSLGRHSHYL